MTSSERLRLAALTLTLGASVLAVPVSAHAQQPQPAPSSATPSAADLETARELYKEGKDLRTRGDLPGALEKLRVAHELGRTPLTGIELARTHVMMGHLVEAREICLGIARIPLASDETERSAAARQEAAKMAEDLKPRIPSLEIALTGVPPGRAAVVMIDRVVVPNDTLREPRRVNPGKHEIVAKMPRGPETSAMVDVAEGQTRTITLAVPPEPPGLPPLPEGTVVITPGPGQQQGQQQQGHGASRREHHGPNALAIAGFVVGGAGVAVGAITGILAFSKASDLERECPDKHCPLDAQGDRQSAVAISTVSTVAFVIGGIGIGTAVIALATSGSGKSSSSEEARARTRPGVEPWLAPTGAGVRGAF